MIKLVFVDTETTGLDAKKNGIVQIAGSMARFDKELEIVERFNFRMRTLPNDVLEQTALDVNGLTVEQINSYPQPNEVHRVLTVLFGKYCDKYNKDDKMFLVGYNARFDYDFMREWFNKLNDKYFGSWFFFPPIDVMQTAIFNLMHERVFLPNFKQVTVAKHLGIEFGEGGAHDADADIKVTEAILQRYLK
jgi:DNA polymerase-3 subunit epsilon